MSDQGILAVTPVNTSTGQPPPADVGDVGSTGESEDELIKQALAELDAGGEQPATETAPETEQKKPEPEKKPDEDLTQKKLSAGFAKLAAKEERFERRQAEATAKDQERESLFAAREAKIKPLEEAQARAQQSPLEALQLLGYSYKDLVDYVMADGKIPPEKFAERLSQQQQTRLDELNAKIAAMEEKSRSAQETWEAQQEQAKNEHTVRALVSNGGAAKYPLFADKFSESPENAAGLMVDVNNVLSLHFNQTSVRDEKGRLIRPGEKLDAERAVAYLEGILVKMQVRPRNPGQPGAVSQTANADAARQSPKPLTPRDSSVTSMPSDDELAQMSQEELDALSLRIYSGG